jgi:hypothetical protein
MMDPITLAMGLATFAPQVVRWVSGSDKAAEVAQKVVDVAETVTGRAGPDAIEALKADPAMVIQFRQRLAEIGADIERAYLQDRQHARTTHRDHWMPWVLTLTLASMVGLMVGALFMLPTPPENREVVYLIAGQLIGAFSTAVAYWLGSSRGSHTKQGEINEVLASMRR